MVQTLLGLADGAQPARRRRRRRARPVPPRHARPLAAGRGRRPGGPAMIGSLRGTLLDRSARRRGPRRGGRASATGSRSPPRPSSSWASSATDVFVHVHHHIREDAQTLYGFIDRDERDVLRGPARRPRRRPGAGAGHPVGARARGAGPGRGRRRRRRPLPGARRRQEDGRPAAHRAEVPPRRAGARRRSGPRRHRAGGPRRAAPTCATRLPAWLPARRGARGAARPARRRRRVGAAARGAPAPGRGVQAVRDELLTPSPRPTTCWSTARRGGRRATRPACARAGSTSSSARPSSRSTWRSSSRPPAGGARPPTTCCSPGRPGLGKTTLAGIVAAEMERRACTSPRARRSSGPATWPPSSPSSTRATCCSSTRSTGCRGRSKRSSTRPWRTSSSTSCWARVRRPARSASTCPASRWSGPPPAPGSSPARCATASVWWPGSTTTTADELRGDRGAGRGHPRRRRSTRTGRARSPGGRGARPASPTGCCAGSATSPRCVATA